LESGSTAATKLISNEAFSRVLEAGAESLAVRNANPVISGQAQMTPGASLPGGGAGERDEYIAASPRFSMENDTYLCSNLSALC
jgi:hypothetical protein